MIVLGARATFSMIATTLLLTELAATSCAQIGNATSTGDPPAGAWIGAAQLNSREVPLRLEITGSGDQVRGALVNEKERSPASSGSFTNGHLILHFDYYANTLDATINDGTLTGTFSGRGHSVPV